jgi:hypothetical protein
MGLETVVRDPCLPWRQGRSANAPRLTRGADLHWRSAPPTRLAMGVWLHAAEAVIAHGAPWISAGLRCKRGLAGLVSALAPGTEAVPEPVRVDGQLVP